jgi:hypothetical protein
MEKILSTWVRSCEITPSIFPIIKIKELANISMTLKPFSCSSRKQCAHTLKFLCAILFYNLRLVNSFPKHGLNFMLNTINNNEDHVKVLADIITKFPPDLTCLTILTDAQCSHVFDEVFKTERDLLPPSSESKWKKTKI